MTRPANIEDMYNHEELFHVSIQGKQSVLQPIIEPGSQRNLISKALRLRKYRLVKDGKEFLINACRPQATDNLLIANQAKRPIKSLNGQETMKNLSSC
ncbi:hypothetical protein L3X38_025341 [Prunus dulcis]|uniref:Uncharacterized protein n=1 Tax=Prunus dulcis TaxID=3755 RepID=A0AAD4W1N0_PRUDU|nr:hypothetical protein L3X38_025341 [Prunus dulcis]